MALPKTLDHKNFMSSQKPRNEIEGYQGSKLWIPASPGSCRNDRSEEQQGFTLIEIIVVIGMFILLAGLTGLMGLDGYRGYSFRSERDNVVSILQKVRAQAMNNTCSGGVCDGGEPHGVYFNGGQFTLFQGQTKDDAPSQNQVISSSYPISLSFNPSGNTSVVFKQLSGDVASPVTITISDNFGHTSDISINGEGRISWTN